MMKDRKITWWSTIEHLEEVSPPKPAREFFPQWYKDIKTLTSPDPLRDGPAGNVKACPSFPLWFQQGYVIPLWTDIELHYEEGSDKLEWRTPDEKWQVGIHPNSQILPYLPQHVREDIAAILKPISPWRVVTPKGYSTMQLPMFYQYNKIFETLPGIIPTDIWHQTNPQMVIKKSAFKDNKLVMLTKGTPLAVYVPFKREEYIYQVCPSTKKLQKEDKLINLKVSGKFRRRLKELETDG
jgi:hypothetical protein